MVSSCELNKTHIKPKYLYINKKSKNKMSDSIENILIGLVRDSNTHMDKINQSVLSNNKLLQTLVEKVNAVEAENKRLHEKIDELVTMNKNLNEKIEKPKKIEKVSKEPKVECSSLTAKGNACTKPCIPGETCCTLHMKMRDKPVIEPKKKRPTLKKKKKDIPIHNHRPGEPPNGLCELCETHGDIFDPDMPDTEFEESQDDSIEERLRKMLDDEKEI